MNKVFTPMLVGLALFGYASEGYSSSFTKADIEIVRSQVIKVYNPPSAEGFHGSEEKSLIKNVNRLFPPTEEVAWDSMRHYNERQALIRMDILLSKLANLSRIPENQEGDRDAAQDYAHQNGEVGNGPNHNQEQPPVAYEGEGHYHNDIAVDIIDDDNLNLNLNLNLNQENDLPPRNNAGKRNHDDMEAGNPNPNQGQQQNALEEEVGIGGENIFIARNQEAGADNERPAKRQFTRKDALLGAAGAISIGAVGYCWYYGINPIPAVVKAITNAFANSTLMSLSAQGGSCIGNQCALVPYSGSALQSTSQVPSFLLREGMYPTSSSTTVQLPPEIGNAVVPSQSNVTLGLPVSAPQSVHLQPLRSVGEIAREDSFFSPLNLLNNFFRGQ